MNSLLTPILFIVLAIALSVTVTSKQYEKVKTLKIQNEEYEVAIQNSNALIKRRDDLLKQYNSFSQQDLRKLGRLVPDSIDNVRLIIDINGVTSKYGVEVKDLKLDSVRSGGASATEEVETLPVDTGDNKPYRSATLSFSLTTNYETFIKILKDLETSLRILDVSSVTFNAGDQEPYTYNVTVKTYWMK